MAASNASHTSMQAAFGNANPVADLFRTQLEASSQLADAMFVGAEKLDRAMIEAAHHIFSDQIQFAQACMSMRDPGSFAQMQASLLSRPDSAGAYQKEFLRVLTEVQSEIGHSMKEYVDRVGAQAGVASPAGLTAQTGDGQGADAVAGVLSVWRDTFRQVTGLANRNMEAARANFVQATNTVNEAAAAAVNEGNGARRATSQSQRRR